MNQLKPLHSIDVPAAQPDQTYNREVCGRQISFIGLKQLLGAADISKAGDRHASLAAPDEIVRETARSILSSLTLQHLYDHPLVDGRGLIDDVMRVNYNIDRQQFASIAPMTVGQLKDHLLTVTGEVIARIGQALTGPMAAAVAKICDVHELIVIAGKCRRTTKARTTLGLPGTLASRLQPNHPVDDPCGIELLVYTGLSMGAGDALIGLNPALDTVENVSRILLHLDQLRRRTKVPSQICVLAHIKTQLACLEQGCPVEIMFQSLAGTDETNRTEFDITVDLLDHAYQTMGHHGPLREIADQFMYFETGQGSEVSYGKHNDIDMTTAEALCYGLARRYDPFMVNNVTGFIGPDTHLDNHEMILANLQDHFMGKLLGLPMGMAPCFTLHSQITLEGQQIASQLLASAGANYYMDVYLNTDRMLAYFDTSGHDNQTLREVTGRTTCPEYLQWAIERGIFAREDDGTVVRGPHWGDPRQFCASDGAFEQLRRAAPMAYGWDNAGSRPADHISRELRINHAIARDAVYSEMPVDELEAMSFRFVQTQADNKNDYLNDARLGAHLASQSLAQLQPENMQVQIVVSDGLSAEAVKHNIGELMPLLVEGFEAHTIRMGQPIAARYARVKLAEELADRLNSELIVLLIGERPGGDIQSSHSLSAYLVYQLMNGGVQEKAAQFSDYAAIRFEYTVISNIHAAGLPPAKAGPAIVERSIAILAHQAAGRRLEHILACEQV